MANVIVSNPTSELQGDRLLTAQHDSTVQGLLSYSRGASPPFAVNAGAGKVANLYVDRAAVADNAVLIGGVDASKFARIDQTNTFAADQMINPSIAGARLTLMDAFAPPDQKAYRLTSQNGQFFVRRLLDSLASAVNTPITVNADGTVVLASDLSLGGTAVAGGNVARRDMTNVFAAQQNMPVAALQGSQPGVIFIDNNQPANLRRFTLWDAAQLLLLDVQDDAGNQLVRALQVNRSGDLVVARDLSEKNRTTPMGHWIDAGTPTLTTTGGSISGGTTSQFSYTLVGKTMWVTFYLQNTTIGTGTQEVRLVIPGNVSAARWTVSYALLTLPGGAEPGLAYAAPGSNVFQIQRHNSAFWPAGTTSIMFTCVVNIQ